jgi:hypothetical protein
LLVFSDFFSELYDALKTQDRRECCDRIHFALAFGNSHSHFASNIPAARVHLSVLRF